MCEWRMCAGLFKGLQNELILKYLHKSKHEGLTPVSITQWLCCVRNTHTNGGSQDKWTVLLGLLWN